VIVIIRVIVKEGVDKSNHPIQNPLLLLTEPRTRDNILGATTVSELISKIKKMCVYAKTTRSQLQMSVQRNPETCTLNIPLSMGNRSRDCSVGIATGYGLNGPCSIPGSARFSSSPQRPHRLWDPPSLLSSVHRDALCRGGG
jgi:hypothetical protein